MSLFGMNMLLFIYYLPVATVEDVLEDDLKKRGLNQCKSLRLRVSHKISLNMK